MVNSTNPERRKIMASLVLGGGALFLGAMGGYTGNRALTQVNELESHLTHVESIAQNSASYIIYQDSYGRVYARNGNNGNVDYEGLDASDVIQSAVNAVANENTQGVIYVKAGQYSLSRPVTLSSGVSIVGVYPVRSNVYPAPPDWPNSVIYGGTVFTGDGTFDALVGDNLIGVNLINLGFRNFRNAINVGSPNALGIAFSVIRNIFLDYPTEAGLRITNFEHLLVNNIQGILNPSSKLMYLINNNGNWDGGNSVFTEVYAVGNPLYTEGVIHLEAVENALGFMVFIRPQVNMLNAEGKGIGILLENKTSRSDGLSKVSMYGIDVEGPVEEALRLVGVQDSFFNFHFSWSGQAWTVHLMDNQYGVPTVSNIITAPFGSILNDSAWENIIIMPWITRMSATPPHTAGIYGLTIVKHPLTEATRPAIYAGDAYSVFDNMYSMYEPGRATKGYATIPPGQVKVTVKHGLRLKPTYVLLTPQATNGNIPKVAVDNVDSESFDIVINEPQQGEVTVYYYAGTFPPMPSS